MLGGFGFIVLKAVAFRGKKKNQVFKRYTWFRKNQKIDK
jgi:hypothetical protein